MVFDPPMSRSYWIRLVTALSYQAKLLVVRVSLASPSLLFL
jgi:hypothetical protein